MSNTFKVTDLVLKECQRTAHEEASFLKTVNRQYDASYNNPGSIGAIGSTLRIRKPNQYKVTTGRTMDAQEVDEETQTITVATQKHVDIPLTSVEITQDVNGMAKFSEQHIRPAMQRLIADIEDDCLVQFTKDVPNVVGAGSFTAAGGFAPGTALSNLTAPSRARARINQQAAPKKDRSMITDSITMGTMVNGAAAYFNPSNAISDQYTEGMVARTSMADWYENEKVWTMSNGADVAGTLDSYTVVDGDTDITVTGFSAAPTEGMVFTIAGLYDCHPETKRGYNYLKQFVVTSASTTAINFSPAVRLSGAKQNVQDSVGGTGDCSAPATDAAVTFYGSASTDYLQSVMYHKDAFTLITADLPLYGGADKCSRSVEDSLAMRVWYDGDITNDQLLMRIDVLYGYKTIRPEWACRVSG